ncbi:MAG: hypothetical protein P1P86_16300 [Bacteroidales bacterium]|nr:hypothetical protein [Bacteroidales bacterium]
MNKVNPSEVLKQVSDVIPENCRENIIIIGSLAASAAYSSDKKVMAVQTKDISCLIRPHAKAAKKGSAIAALFKEEWKELAGRAGKGLRMLLQSPDDLEEAHYTCRYGLLSSYPVSEDDLREVGERLLGDAVKMLEDQVS